MGGTRVHRSTSDANAVTVADLQGRIPRVVRRDVSSEGPGAPKARAGSAPHARVTPPRPVAARGRSGSRHAGVRRGGVVLGFSGMVAGAAAMSAGVMLGNAAPTADGPVGTDTTSFAAPKNHVSGPPGHEGARPASSGQALHRPDVRLPVDDLTTPAGDDAKRVAAAAPSHAISRTAGVAVHAPRPSQRWVVPPTAGQGPSPAPEASDEQQQPSETPPQSETPEPSPAPEPSDEQQRPSETPEPSPAPEPSDEQQRPSERPQPSETPEPSERPQQSETPESSDTSTEEAQATEADEHESEDSEGDGSDGESGPRAAESERRDP